MLITLFSDASLCPTTRRGGWAAWLKSSNGTVRGGGQLRRLTNDTTIAEAMAVVNGIATGLREGLISPGDEILCQTDNNGVVGVLEADVARKCHKASLLIAEVAEAFQRILDENRLTTRWRHVRGHGGTGDKRSAVNTDCDARARFHMREARIGAAPWVDDSDVTKVKALRAEIAANEMTIAAIEDAKSRVREEALARLASAKQAAQANAARASMKTSENGLLQEKTPVIQGIPGPARGEPVKKPVPVQSERPAVPVKTLPVKTLPKSVHRPTPRRKAEPVATPRPKRAARRRSRSRKRADTISR